MAELTRLELATFRVTGGRSNQTELQLHNIYIFHDTTPKILALVIRSLPRR